MSGDAISDDAADAGPDAESLEAGRLLFAKECRFVMGIAAMAQLPDTGLPEVAFAGRSNVGKSSLLNTLTGRKALARTSNTPGRTQQLNFFELGERLMLVDLPGYGYARASKRDVHRWTALTRDYLKGRAALRRVCLLIDARHGLKDKDREVMAVLDQAAVSYQIVLTKADKLDPDDMATARTAMSRALSRHPAAHPRVHMTSANSGAGVPELRADLATLAASPPGG